MTALSKDVVTDLKRRIAALEQQAQTQAIENARLFNETREALAQQTATAEILAAINNSGGNLAPVFECILEKAHQLCGAPCGSLQLYRDNRVTAVATRGMTPAFDEFLRRGYPFAEGIRSGLLTDRPMQRADVAEMLKDRADEPSFSATRASVELGGIRTMAWVPLLKNGTAFGRIVAARQEVRPFDDKQIATLQVFAAQAVIAIENARLLQELRARTDDLSESLQQQTVTADVLKVISRSAFDLQTVLETLTQSAVNLCEAQQGIIFLRDGDLYRAEAVAGGGPDYLEFLKKHPRKPGRESICPRVALSGTVEQIPDVLEDAEYHFPGVTKISGNRALLGVPLLREGRIEGVFALGRSEPGGFTERQVELVQTFADQAVIAIENARLFNEVQSRTQELAKSLDELRAAQDRLIQTEKLASLGQLTAGIAHEIKNPLNFVNNFAALSAELTDELDRALGPVELDAKIRDEVSELTGMLKDNLQKVVQHGRRADSIVKNMLLHSREGSGEHRPTDINALVEESLNLAYHGARAEKPQFNVTLERELDPNAGTIEAFPQEITRVLLNLISNGFYAAAMRKAENGETGFEPVVKATTCGRPGHVEIRIRDNGTGIPLEVKDKIFNPFFTTKPAGEGTGLGLSMTHDIVVKQHGGTIDVATHPGEFTEFIISLPRTSDLSNKTRG
ncbi:GAF domain-containing protein [Bradyrhizobium sp. Tv2a-2]|uniref:GAF domain-containing protein n=1 Tax=Bradyrhizobium sp. Tv2a-2 TaxID=113395 RepID=UPI001FD8B5ED|nr:GAF domain-containing protein [Bradyrhizobium sp. Tv2a-2]